MNGVWSYWVQTPGLVLFLLYKYATPFKNGVADAGVPRRVTPAS